MKQPNKVTVGAYDYDIVFVPRLSEDHRLLGQSLCDTQQIKLAENMTDQTKNEVFWHEAIHAINVVYGCKLSESNTERLAHGITAILKNDFNEVIKWNG